VRLLPIPIKTRIQPSAPVTIEFKPAPADLTADYIRLRGLTRENAVSEERLRALGVTAESWAQDIRSEELRGIVAMSHAQMVGYCFGNFGSGEIIVLAVSPTFEGKGIGQRLLAMVVELLHGHGHQRLFLGCASDPAVRSHGFYRHLGWRSTGAVDDRGDEVLELVQQ
jgi:GNAT superfamily N-acetyltransferase